MTDSKSQTSCRVCHSAQLVPYLELGSTPLANSYITAAALLSPEFREELTLQLCTKCGLSQLTKVVSPDRMFKNYLYVSSTTETFRSHCVELARTATAVAGCKQGDLILDIASNDGCLLSKFKERGMRVIGVDPAENLAKEANAAGIETVNAYWSSAAAKEIVSRVGSPKVITATNVFAHVDDVHEFVGAVDACLSKGGVFIIECPYILDFIERNEFDTAYHEHLSYLGITPISSLVEQYGFHVFDIEYFEDLHGGTIRVYICRTSDFPLKDRVHQFLERERKFRIKEVEPYHVFARRVQVNRNLLVELLTQEQRKRKVIWGYGASAKGNTLSNFFEISKDAVPVVIDDNPKKWKLYTPGTHMRITGISELHNASVDHLLLLAWNFQKEIVHRCRSAGYTGSFIVPVPTPKIISE